MIYHQIANWVLHRDCIELFDCKYHILLEDQYFDNNLQYQILHYSLYPIYDHGPSDGDSNYLYYLLKFSVLALSFLS